MRLRCELVVLVTAVGSVLTLPALPPPRQEDPSHPMGSDLGLYNPGLFQGDIILAEKTQLPQRNAVRDPGSLWPHGTVVYSLDPSIGCPGSEHCRLLTASMEQLQSHSCVRFKQWSGEPHRVHVFLNPNSGECWSGVGRTGDAKQLLSLGSNCWHRGIVLHELLHAVGFWHEMTRPDRDHFVHVYWNNILPGFSGAFVKQSVYEVDTLGEHFDYRSIMMYDEYAFSKDGVSETMRATAPGVVIGPIWRKEQLSEGDTRRLHALYDCQGSADLPGFPYDVSCDFSSNSCGFKNSGASLWTWRRVTAAEGFMYTSLERYGGSRRGFLHSSTLHGVVAGSRASGDLGCVRFWFFLESNSPDSYLRLLHAYVETASATNFNPKSAPELWISGPPTGSWVHVQMPLYITRPFKLLFESWFGGNSTAGTMALDDVELLYSPCTEASSSAAESKKSRAAPPPQAVSLWDAPLD